MHRELGVDAEMHVGIFEEGKQPRQLHLERTPGNLDVQKKQRVPASRPAVHALDERIWHPEAIHAVSARVALGNDRDEVKCRLHGCRRVGFTPMPRYRVQPCKHVVHRVLAEHAHAFGERIAVERDDALRRQDGTCERLRALHRPLVLAFAGANRRDV